MNVLAVLKKLDEIDKSNSSVYLYEGLSTSNKKSVFLWESAGKKLIEANLTVDQINQIFADVEQKATASGSNRTLIGKGKDAASAVNKAWEDLKTKVQDSGPIKNVDAMYDQAAEKLKQATGGDQGVMKYVQMYRDFAKKHPIAQSFIYAALIAAAGISGAGLGGAAALGLFKMTDKLLQGEKFSSAAYQGAKTGGMAYAAGQIGQALKGKPEAPSGPPGEGSYTSYPQPTNPDGSLMTPQEIAAAKDSLKVGSNAASSTSNWAADASMPNQLQGLAKLVDAGKPLSKEQMDGLSQFVNKFGTFRGNWETNPDGTASELMKKFMSADGLLKRAMTLQGQQGLKENSNLTTQQINLIFEHVSDSIILEGIWDSLKGAAGKAANWAQTKGANLTNKVTADKLQQAWKAAGSPTDSEDVKKVLQSAGVDAGIIDQAFTGIGSQASDTSATPTQDASQSASSAETKPMKAAEIVKSLNDVWAKATADQGSDTSSFPVQNQIRTMAKQAGLAGQTFESKNKPVVEFYSKFLNMKI